MKGLGNVLKILNTSQGEGKSCFCKDLFPLLRIFPFILLLLSRYFFQGNANKGYQVPSHSEEIQDYMKMTADCSWVKVAGAWQERDKVCECVKKRDQMRIFDSTARANLYKN